MKNVLTIITIQFLLLCFTISNAQPTTPPAPPTPVPPVASQDLAAQMQQLQHQMELLQQQLKQLQQQTQLSDSSGKRVIIINGQRMDGFDENAFDSSMESLANNMSGLDSNMKIYSNNDSMVINMGKMKLRMFDKNPNQPFRIERNEDIIINHNDSTSHPRKFIINIGGFRLGLNNYLYKGKFENAPGYDPLELIPGKSIDVGIGVFDAKLNIIKSYLTLHTMLGFDISNYRFNSTDMLIQKVDTVGFNKPSGDQTVSKNKLVTTYLVLPVRLQWETSSNTGKAFRLGAGGRIGYLIGSHTKFIVNDQKIKQRDDFNLDVFKYGLEFVIGYSWFNLYFDYDLTPFFSNGVNPSLTPVSMGIVLGNF